ncbi:dynamin family protein [Undibacterium sp. WLX3042]|uniref:dynamin family protein n=1 Tax=Undibacterium sp. WLX3042 TaxID=3412686 RepID=UPI003C2FAA8A
MSNPTLVNRLTQLCQDLSVWENRHFQSDIAKIKELKADLQTKLDRFSQQEQVLSIGIIGQVKAGKSSFLNALLFGGHPVLPEAATPKTANLTKISYGEQPLLEVLYYTPEEWQEIERLASGDGEHDEAKVARELCKMMEGKGVDIASVLSQQQASFPAQDVTDLTRMMNDYVGENGRYTALVKATHLYFPIRELKGLHVVDTPGMNDPVQSRTQHTKEYMASCDVVFFLSRCSQFLNESDMDLLMRQLPSRGVKRIILVAGQFDSVLLDDGYDRESLEVTEKNIRQRIIARASKELENVALAREEQGAEYAEIAGLMRGMKIPVIASTYAHAFATSPQEQWSDGMRHIFSELTNLAKDQWSSYQISQEDWERISNFDTLTKAYQTARQDKQALLDAQKQALIPEIHRGLQENLNSLIEKIEDRIKQLSTKDLGELETAQAQCQKRLHKITSSLKQELSKAKIDADTTRHAMLNELQQGLAAFSKIKSRTGTETIETYYEVSTSSWWNPFSWGDTKRVYSTSSRSYDYFATADAVEKVTHYSNDSVGNLQRAFNRMINPKLLKENLRTALLQELNTSDANFDPGHFRSVLSDTLDQLALPSLELNLGDTTEAITKNFSGEIRGSADADKLRAALQHALEMVLTKLSKEFDEKVNALCIKLESISNSLADKLSERLQNELSALRKAYANKENEIKTYEAILTVAKQYHSSTQPI